MKARSDAERVIFPVLVTAILIVLVWLGVAGQIWDAAIGSSKSDWLGFLGNIVGAVGTVFAGWLAWKSSKDTLDLVNIQAAIDLMPVLEEDEEKLRRDRSLLHQAALSLRGIADALSALEMKKPTEDWLKETEVALKTIQLTLGQINSDQWREFSRRLRLVNRSQRIAFEDLITNAAESCGHFAFQASQVAFDLNFKGIDKSSELASNMSKELTELRDAVIAGGNSMINAVVEELSLNADRALRMEKIIRKF